MTEAPTTKDNGGYDLLGYVWHQHSNRLMEHILKVFPKDVPVLDIGCGHNFYVSCLNLASYTALGCDMVDPGSKYFFKADVTEKIINPFPEKANVISLEVGEHLPRDYHYLDNLCSFGGDVLMSWALPGQAGHGHINCQPMQWIIEHMQRRGYKLDFPMTHEFRNAVKDCHCSWFKNTLLYFRPI